MPGVQWKKDMHAFAQRSSEDIDPDPSPQPEPSVPDNPGRDVRQKRVEAARLSMAGSNARETFDLQHKGSNDPNPIEAGHVEASDLSRPREAPAPDRTSVLQSGVHQAKDMFHPGSELGDSYMDTTILSTPKHELGDPQNELEDDDSPRKLKKDSGKSYSSQTQRGPRYRSTERVQPEFQFMIGHDGMIEVGNAEPSNAQYEIGDGFRHEQEPTRSRTSHRNKKTSLGMRIVRKRSPNRAQPGYDDEEKHGSPTRTSSQRREKHHKTALQLERSSIGIDQRQTTDDHAGDGLEDEKERTPKAKKTARRQTSTQSPRSTLEQEKKHGAASRKREATPDYDDSALGSMAFSDLQGQPFDLDPVRVTSQNGRGHSNMTLEDKLKQQQARGEEEQRALFAAMSVKDWEASGDWFADQFGMIMKQLREARCEKRNAIAEFEAEVAVRERAVRARSEGIDRKLARMKHDGQRVVKEFQS